MDNNIDSGKNQVERWVIAPNLEISRVLTGLWQIADMERDNRQLNLADAATSIKPYVDAGFTTFDMADHYGSAEVIAGLYTKEFGHETAQMFTKWVPAPGPASREDVRAAVHTALDRLCRSQIDLFQFHAWNYADPNYLETLFYLQELKQEGLIRHLGVTNVDTAHLEMMIESGIEIVSNQVCFSLLDQRAKTNGMLDLCREKGVSILAFGTLAGGFLTERWFDVPEPDWQELETWSQMKYGRFIRESGGWDKLQMVLNAVHQVASSKQVSMANVACRYILDQPAVGGIIVGARLGLSEHIEDNLNLFKFKLSQADHDLIDSAVALLDKIPGDCGDEYRKPPFLTAAGDLSDHLESLPTPFDVKDGENGKTRVFSGTVWEEKAGFCRAVKHGRHIHVSGTTATCGSSHVIGGSNPASQTQFILDKIEGALASVGAGLEDVVRTRIYLKNKSDWEAVSRVHGRVFKTIQPANTLICADLIGDGYLVEIEADAMI